MTYLAIVEKGYLDVVAEQLEKLGATKCKTLKNINVIIIEGLSKEAIQSIEHVEAVEAETQYYTCD